MNMRYFNGIIKNNKINMGDGKMQNLNGLYRRNGKKVYIKQPEYKELEFVSKLWSDEETMKDIGGTFSFPKSKWEMFYKKMVYPTDGKNFYCLIYTTADKAVGEVSFHGYDSATKIARFNIKIHNRYRNMGYGKEAIKLLLEYYFLEFGGDVIMDNISTVSGAKIAKNLGFEEVGKYKDETTIKITKESFFNNNRSKSKTVALLMYDGINALYSSMFYELLTLANNIAGEKIFNILNITFKEQLNISTGIHVNLPIEKLHEKIDILLLSDGNFKDNNCIEYIMTHFNECDYICASGKSIKFLIKCRALDGIFIPKLQVSCEDMKVIGENRLIQKNFVDNGKIMLSANVMGQVELILSLIDKVGGRELAEKVAYKIGLN